MGETKISKTCHTLAALKKLIKNKNNHGAREGHDEAPASTGKCRHFPHVFNFRFLLISP